MSKFITIEGIEGAGKSTLRSHLADAAREFGVEVVVTREPGATPLGRSLRQLLLNPDTKDLDIIAELMLFSADRAQHVAEVIQPALKRKALVLCDRFIHSTIAYQGYARGIPLEQLYYLNNIVTQGLKPDLVLLLDLDPEVGLARAQQRTEKATGSFNLQKMLQREISASGERDRFEQQSLEFHQAVRYGFLELAKDPQNKFVVLDAAKPVQKIVAEALASMRQVLV